jgi:hypothetical protein
MGYFFRSVEQGSTGVDVSSSFSGALNKNLRPCLDHQIGSTKSLFDTVAILFLFGNNCPNID